MNNNAPMPFGIIIGILFAVCAVLASIMEALAIFGFIKVIYPESSLSHTVHFLVQLPLILLFILSAFGLISRNNLARKGAVIFWPSVGFLFIFQSLVEPGVSVIDLIFTLVVIAAITGAAWWYFYKKQNVLRFFGEE